MIILLSFILGVVFGIWRARVRKGDVADMAQYAAVFGLIFATIGAILTVTLLRMV